MLDLQGIPIGGFDSIGMMEWWNNGTMGSVIMQCWVNIKYMLKIK